MKRVFRFKKDQKTDGDEEIVHFLEEYLCDYEDDKGAFPKFRKNWKVTINIQEE